MEGFDTMTMSYLASPLALGNMQNTDYLNPVPGMDIPEQRPPFDTETFVRYALLVSSLPSLPSPFFLRACS
jgi:hypothetical protein